MIKKQMPMNLNFADPKIKIFCDFRVSVLSPIPASENSDITEIYQKPQKTEIWECNFKTLELLFKWHHSQNDPATLLIMCHMFQEILTTVDLLNWVWFFCLFVLFISVLILKKLKQWSKTDPHSFVLDRPKTKDLPWFPDFRFEPYTQKRKLGNHGNSTKTP